MKWPVSVCKDLVIQQNVSCIIMIISKSIESLSHHRNLSPNSLDGGWWGGCV